jgi:tetratricopeptide (TPR) repeat protein
MWVMTSPRAVVIPFGVPEDGRGLGLGLAALVHSFALIDGESVALAQLLSRSTRGSEAVADVAARPSGDEDEDDGENAPRHGREGGPVEAFVPPQTWKDLAGGGGAPSGVSYVVTGAFEPPTDGRGLIQLLVFDAKNGRTRARVEAPVDGDNAGRSLLAAFEEAWSLVGGELGPVRDIDDLSWDALESVLLAERCALHDPLRGGPHDRLAAMVHLGRAIGDAPESRYPASRLASLALDVAVAQPSDGKLADAAMRALVRATADAPANADLVEAIAALYLRQGDAASAERRAEEAIAIDRGRARLYALLSEARRSRGDLPGALGAIEEGLLHDATDPLLGTERGIVLLERGKLVEAEAALRMVLGARPLYPPAFSNLASLLMERKDGAAAARLVDDVLQRAQGAHPDVLRRAVQLSIAVEPEGIARAARIVRLASALVERQPEDAWAVLVLARALSQTGERMAAARRLHQVEHLAKGSALASEAQRGRLALEEPQAAVEIDAVLRAAYQAAPADLDTIAARARTLGVAHESWCAYLAAGIAERRLERWRPARGALEEAVRLSPGCTPAHMELAGALVALSEPEAALDHARRACDLDGETARTLSVLATTLLASGRREEAAVAIDRALALDATDEANRALAARIRQRRASRPSALTRLREIFGRGRGRKR